MPEMTFRWMLVCLCVNRSKSPKDRWAGRARYCISSYVTEAALRGEKNAGFPHCYNDSPQSDDLKGLEMILKGESTVLAMLPKFSALQSS